MTNSQRKRIVLVGLTGTGKSSTGNLFGPLYEWSDSDNHAVNFDKKIKFETSHDVDSCTRKGQTLYSPRYNLLITDTIGLHDTENDASIVLEQLRSDIMAIKDGVDAVLFFFASNRYDSNNQIAFAAMMELLGDGVKPYLIVVRSHSQQKEVLHAEIGKEWLENQCIPRKTEVLADFCNQCLGIAKTSFKTMIEACSNRVAFVENGDPSNESALCKKVQEASARNVLEQINKIDSTNMGKFRPVVFENALLKFQADVRALDDREKEELEKASSEEPLKGEENQCKIVAIRAKYDAKRQFMTSKKEDIISTEMNQQICTKLKKIGFVLVVVGALGALFFAPAVAVATGAGAAEVAVTVIAGATAALSGVVGIAAARFAAAVKSVKSVKSAGGSKSSVKACTIL